MTRVDVLLATYNGAAYLPELLDSLWAQVDVDFTVIARDDGSSDGTPAILQAHAARHPGRLVVLETETPCRSAKGNFSRLLQASRAPYFLCADQDDIWAPHKVAATVRAIQAIEAARGGSWPVLVHADLQVVDAQRQLLGNSFWAFQNLDPVAGGRFERLLVQNVVTGCAAGGNAALRHLCPEIPVQAVMHDWWLALVAAGFGTLHPLPEALIAYRQHGANDTGAKRWSAKHIVRQTLGTLSGDLASRSIQPLWRQAQAFRELYGPRLPEDQRHALEAFCALPACGWLRRRQLILRHGFVKSGLLRTLGWLWAV